VAGGPRVFQPANKTSIIAMQCSHLLVCMLGAMMGYQLRQMLTMGKERCGVPASFTSIVMKDLGWSFLKEEFLAGNTLNSQQDAEEGFLQPVPEDQVLSEVPEPFFCDPLEHVVVINLEDDRGKGRREHMIQQFQKAGIEKYHFFPAVDFQKDEQLKREMKLLPRFCANPAQCANNLGCAMSHRRVYEKMIAEKWPCALIFEDDAALADNFGSKMQAITLGGLPAFDIILLGWCGGRPKNKPPEDQVSIPQLKNGWPGMCIHASVVSIYGAWMNLRVNTPIYMTPDALLDGVHHHKNKTRTHISREKGTYQGSYWYTAPILSWQDKGADGLGGGV